jgi:hypothetical protein
VPGGAGVVQVADTARDLFGEKAFSGVERLALRLSQFSDEPAALAGAEGLGDKPRWAGGWAEGQARLLAPVVGAV